MSDSDNAVVDSIAVELSNSSYKEREPVCNEGEGDPDKGGGVHSNEAIRTELGLELVAKIAVIPVVRSEAVPPVSILVVVGVVGGKEEGGRDDMVRATWAMYTDRLQNSCYFARSIRDTPRSDRHAPVPKLWQNIAIQR